MGVMCATERHQPRCGVRHIMTESPTGAWFSCRGAGYPSFMPNPIELQRRLAGVDYPCRKADLIAAARKNGADQPLLDELDKLPDVQYSGPHRVQEEMF